MYKKFLSPILILSLLLCVNVEAKNKGKNNKNKKRIAKRVKLYKKLLTSNKKHLSELNNELSAAADKPRLTKDAIQRKIDAIISANDRYNKYIAKHGGGKK